MNATATTEAKTEEKAINKMSREELEAKKAELNNKLDDPAFLIDFDALSKQKRQILEAIQKLDAAREGEVEEVSKKIAQYKIKFSELSEAARQALGAVVAQAAAPAAKKRGPAQGSTRNVQEGPILLSVKTEGAKGAPTTYKPKMKIQTIGKNYLDLYAANKENFKAALEGKFTDEGKTYFADPANHAELDRLIGLIKKEFEKK